MTSSACCSRRNRRTLSFPLVHAWCSGVQPNGSVSASDLPAASSMVISAMSPRAAASQRLPLISGSASFPDLAKGDVMVCRRLLMVLSRGGGFPEKVVGRLLTPLGGGGGLIQPSGPPPPKSSIDRPPKNPTQTDPRGPGGDPDPKFGKKRKRKRNFWNQCLKGVQKSHHLPCIGGGGGLTIFNAENFFDARVQNN